MKQLIIFLATFFLSSLMRAVTITEQQRQEALNTTRTFCSLISQYSSGGSSSLDLDQRILQCQVRIWRLTIIWLVISM